MDLRKYTSHSTVFKPGGGKIRWGLKMTKALSLLSGTGILPVGVQGRSALPAGGPHDHEYQERGLYHLGTP